MCELDSVFSEYEHLEGDFVPNSNRERSIVFGALVRNKCTSLKELVTII
jgi:hypothetical protein